MTIEQEIAGTVPATLEVPEETSVQALPENAKWSSAGIAALLSNDPMELERTFGMLLSDFDNGNVSSLSRVRDAAVQQESEANRAFLIEELSKPDVSLERKQSIIDILARKEEWQRDTATLVTERYLTSPSGNETVEQERNRTALAERLKPVHEARREMVTLRNALAKEYEDTSRFTKVDEFLETILPFAPNAEAVDTLKRIQQTVGNPKNGVVNFLLYGEGTTAVRQALERMPPELLRQKVKEIGEAIKKDSGLLIRDDNNTAELAMFERLFGDYSTTDRLVDNVISLLDSSILLAPVASLAGKPIQRALQVAKMERAVRNLERSSFADRVAEHSAASIARTANPDKARDIHKIAVSVENDTAAKALYGTAREDALISDIIPQIDTVDGTVPVRVPDIEKKVIEVDKDIVDFVADNVSYRYTDAEYQRAVNEVVNDFHNATGLHVNGAMGQIGVSDDGARVFVKGVYGNTEGGFQSAEQALEKAKRAFRHRGIKDEEITLLERDGLSYKPVKFEEVKGKDGEYLVQVKMDITAETRNFDQLSVKYNIFDRIPTFQWARSGNLQRWFTDPGSMFSKYISGAASVAIDRAAALDKKLLAYYADFANSARKLKADRQDKLMEHILEANAQGLELDDASLLAKGFVSEEIDTLKKWRRANDTMFYLENSDLVKTLNHQGYQLLDDGVDRFFAKAVSNRGLKEQVYDRTTRSYDTLSVNVYDPVQKQVIRLSERELDDLYTNGGSFAKLRRPEQLNGVPVEYVKVDNSATHYLRNLRDTDQVLNYRKGYFHVEYDAPLFIVQKVRDASGNVAYEKRVAVAGSSKDANNTLKDLAIRDGMSPEEWGFIAEDKRKLALDGDAYWDIQSASGRVSQRHRGKRLEGLTGTNLIGQNVEYIVDPIEASIKAARSLSARVATRDTLETMKARAMAQYGEFFPGDGMGGVRWPSNPNDIVSKTKSTTKDIADARTTWEYINYLENGYINTMDTSWKWAMNGIANTLGKLNLTAAEKVAYGLQNLAPSQTGKEFVFHMYIGTNPLRQLLVQPHQAVRMMGYNPRGFIQSNKYVMGFLQSKIAPNAAFSKEQAAFNKALDDSGLMAAVDKQNLVRGALVQMTDDSNKYKRMVGKALAAPRVVGFDAGERVNIMAHYANVWDKKKRQGLDVFDKRVQQEIHSEARALSYDMNIAGDMPYNQNWAALLMQFAQVPHKAALQIANRRIAPSDRVKLALFDASMWGVPIYTLSDWVGKDLTPDDPELRAIVTQGLEQFIFNHNITKILGPEAAIDLRGSFSPYDWGWAEVAHTILTDGGIAEALGKSPSGKLLFGDSSRLGEAFTTLGQFLHMKESYGTDPTAWNVATDFLRISSGFRGLSDAYRAAYLRELNAAMTKEGVVLDRERSNFEVLAAIAGFQNKSITDIYQMSETLYKDNERFKKEVDAAYKEVKRTLFSKSQAPLDELKHMAQVLGEMERVYKHNPDVMRYVTNKLSGDVRGKDKWIIQLALKAAGRGEFTIPTLLKRIEDSPTFTPEDKEAARIILQDAENAAKYFEELEQ